jgi:hypothetical protein
VLELDDRHVAFLEAGDQVDRDEVERLLTLVDAANIGEQETLLL